MDDWPQTAEALMRSRFAAFKVGDAEWVRATWHESTRPTDLDLTDNPTWRGLQIIDVVDGGPEDDTGIVEFRATYLDSGAIGVLHERSRFIKDGGRWFYIDGQIEP
ncbi:preprotein translocase [Flaviflexus salsibiostraticola]|uniref:Preprotein translocase n=1 Tax=Flaviflexus salsibiostraticola TaxID=1282737 RepID=A0A3S8ZBA9_9ACTO|nr:YchJ family metal-binding protein [Flaviflexus salsibiostraticola]AZN30767.1 preprotein translocase [Flaviflexus salsibiostraticola]